MQELHKRIGCHISVFLGAVAQLPRCITVSRKTTGFQQPGTSSFLCIRWKLVTLPPVTIILTSALKTKPQCFEPFWIRGHLGHESSGILGDELRFDVLTSALTKGLCWLFWIASLRTSVPCFSYAMILSLGERSHPSWCFTRIYWTFSVTQWLKNMQSQGGPSHAGSGHSLAFICHKRHNCDLKCVRLLTCQTVHFSPRYQSDTQRWQAIHLPSSPSCFWIP